MDLTRVPNYELIEKRFIEDLKVDSYLLKHKKSGARVAVLECDDENKVFYIGFRTPPKNSTGVAHILEHSTLCGSEKYPSKDPFVELAKGSLNTFLNAMTYPDKTVYPIASCNDQDFKNLMDIYLDAVFHPNIAKNDKIFKQEGWHYEMESVSDDLKINGVVYNEMKGAFSSPDDVISREIFNSLYPDTAYGVESGGDPDVIPELSYEEFLDFHKQYYHPVNSYIYLYGNADMAERLAYLDEEYLSNYDVIDIDSMPGEQASFDSAKEIEKTYPILDDEDEENNTYLSYNTVCDYALNRDMVIAMQVVDYALIASQGTPIRKALLDAGIGNDIYSVYEGGIYQPYYSIVAKNANAEDKDRFVAIIEETLGRVISEGFDQNALLAGLNNMEFRYRESDFGSLPRGLMLGLASFDSWLYDDMQPFIHIECNETFKRLREKIGTSYYEELVEEYILNNSHKSIVVVSPEKGLTNKKEQALKEKLAAYKATLTEDELQKIVDETKALKLFQETPDSEEVLALIPKLKREDLKKTTNPYVNELMDIDGHKVLFHDIYTNGISYISLMFKLGDVPVELLPYLGIFKNVLTCLDTKSYSYEVLGYELDKYSGALDTSMAVFTNNKNRDDYSIFFEIKTKIFSDNASNIVELIKEIIYTSNYHDYKRMKEIILEVKSQIQAGFMSAGHSASYNRALSYISESNAKMEEVSGLGFYRFLEKAEKDYDSMKEDIASKMELLAKYIFNKDNLLVDFIGEKKDLDKFMTEAKSLFDDLFEEEIKLEGSSIKVSKKNEGFVTSASVNYVSRVGNFLNHGLSYTGALKVLKTILGYEYLWQEVRVKGGAYGGFGMLVRTGDGIFTSYRDPNLESTIEIYERASQFVKEFKADEKTMTKFIIGTMSDLDTPLTPRLQGKRSLAGYLSNVTVEDLQKERDEILAATDEDIRNLAGHIEAVMSDGALCVIGTESSINGAKDKFTTIESLN